MDNGRCTPNNTPSVKACVVRGYGRNFDQKAGKGTFIRACLPKSHEIARSRVMSSDKRTESNNAMAVPVERRRNLRFPFSATVEAVDNKSGTKVIGRTSDLGLG